MPNAMTTVGQGSAAYVSVGGTAITNASTQNWRIGGKHKVPSLAVNSQIAGQSSSTQHAVRVYTDGSVAFRTTATDRVRTAAGVVSPGVDFTWALENKVGVGMTLTVNGADIGTFGTSSNFPINQLHRFSTTAASEVTTSEFFHELAGVMQSQWNATNAPGTGTVWTSSGAVSRTLTITAHTGVADSWWVFYSNNQIGESTFSAVAVASATVNGVKVGQTTASIQSTISAAVLGVKIGMAPVVTALNLGIVLPANKVGASVAGVAASALLSLQSHKVGLSTVSLTAEASISVYSGNNYVGEGTFSVSAGVAVSLQGSKVGTSQVQFQAVAAAYCGASKIGSASASLECNVTSQLQASKTGSSSLAVLASVTISLSGSNSNIAAEPVTLLFVQTSSRHTHSVTTSSRYTYNLKTSSGGARV